MSSNDNTIADNLDNDLNRLSAEDTIAWDEVYCPQTDLFANSASDRSIISKVDVNGAP